MKKFESTFEYKLIYIFRINDKEHTNCLKIGDATISTQKNFLDLPNNCSELNNAAKKRINEYTSTAGINYDLLHTEIAAYVCNNKNNKKYGKVIAFRDYKVHDVLKRSGIECKYFNTDRRQNEWFITDLETAKHAIEAVKNEKSALNNSEISNYKNPIIFRPEQKEAIKQTIDRFKTDKQMLWNAKMRFGKTLTALQVVKEKEFKRTIIITHRPVVSDGWFDDFYKIFYDRDDYFFGSKTKGKKIDELIENDLNFVYFASMQDLRGSDIVGGNFNKNDKIFNIDWDFVVVDEAHEGTKTELGKNVLSKIIKNDSDYNTYVLQLSGTPFNLITDFKEENIYTWDYIMEQEAKDNWNKNNFGDSNPYEELPRLNIFTYHIEKDLPEYIDVMDKAFNFKEFFRTWSGDIKKDFKQIPNDSAVGKFVHEKDIIGFLNLICKLDEDSNYPYSTDEYRDYFRHSLWVLPGVKEAKALSSLLKEHKIFKNFKIVNVAGDGDEEIDTSDALKSVKEAISNSPEETYTITLSCGRLTTGVSIPEWTAVFMLAGTYSTAASQYLQTIFRVQTPANINGKIKNECYVFDFAPDRTLKMIAESVQLSSRAGANNSLAEISLGKFLNYCSVVSIDNTGMKEYKVAYLLQELKKAYAERVARNGFDDPKIYNDELLQLSEIELKEFEGLRTIIGESKQSKKVEKIDINNEGFTQAELEEEKRLKKKKEKELTEEELKRKEELKEKRKNRDSAISILRAISIRMPLLVYGMDKDINTEITIDNFADENFIDDLSWNEFMPMGVTKEIFRKFSKYYDKDIFVAASRRIRNISKTADELEPTERVKRIASLFSTFKNPDKETVLTPWRVVNMHLSDTIGGYDFYDEQHINMLEEPRFVDRGEVTKNIFDSKSNIMEINSKTGLYPLYMTYSLYMKKIAEIGVDNVTLEDKLNIWDEVVKNQLFIVCKTPMAKQITKRTLLGYRDGQTNMHSFDDLVMQIKDKQDRLIQKIKSSNFWNKGGNEDMKFNAIVGNPPYQEQDRGTNESDSVSRTSAVSVYQYFVQSSKKISDQYVSLIIPSRWMTGGRGLDDFRAENIKDTKFALIHDYENDQEVFPNTDIGGGIMYFLWDSLHDGELDYYLHNGNSVDYSRRFLDTGDNIVIRDYASAQILKKINSDETFMELVSSRKPFGFGADITRKNPDKFVNEQDNEHNVKFYCWDGVPTIKYMNDNEIKDKKLLKSYKVFISKTADPPIRFGRENKDILRKPFLGEPLDACSETYLTIGCFDDKYQTEAIQKYIKTKFFRFLVLQKKKTQNVSKGVFEFVPMQNFKQNSDIDWSTSIIDLDEQLFKKYGFSSEEIYYINNKVDYFSE